jgi:hypothetical protein
MITTPCIAAGSVAEAARSCPGVSAKAIRATKPGSGRESPDALTSGMGSTTATKRPASIRHHADAETPSKDRS